jgi:glycosyltransferase involved in cell wall biosynthesis
MSELLSKLEDSIENLKSKKSKIYFFVQDTKGNPKASIKYIYDLAFALKNNGYNSIILHEKPDYFGVQDWLGSSYMEITHISVEGQNLQVSPDDVILVPEIFGYVMPQLTNLPCFKIVICQSYDYIFETLQPGQTWAQLGFNKCITTSDKMKEYISSVMKQCSVDIIEPFIDKSFNRPKLPPKPTVAIHTREQRDSINFIKSFYVRFPQYRWITFKDMRGLSQEQFANSLKDCMLSIWIDETSSFGTFPLESMKCGVPVIGKVPKLIPSWINENNGIWLQDILRIEDVVADFIQNWMEDNVSDKLYEGCEETSKRFDNEENFIKTTVEFFEKIYTNRIEIFEKEINKLQIETNI